MASKVEICNMALLKLNASIITSLTENSKAARNCNLVYEPTKLAELRKHFWSFSIKRDQLAADSTAPLFTKTNSFTLPSDFVKLVSPDPEDLTNNLDWIIEGKAIYTDDSAPLNIRYVYNVTDVNEMDSLFRDTLSFKIAINLADALTQSNSKKRNLFVEYKDSIAAARKANAIEKISQKTPEDEWVTVRNS